MKTFVLLLLINQFQERISEYNSVYDLDILKIYLNELQYEVLQKISAFCVYSNCYDLNDYR